jgi:hypothetical protein
MFHIGPMTTQKGGGLVLLLTDGEDLSWYNEKGRRGRSRRSCGCRSHAWNATLLLILLLILILILAVKSSKEHTRSTQGARKEHTRSVGAWENERQEAGS